MSTILPPVSVIVPVRNAYDTLRPCIEALLGQDYRGVYEIVMVDNGSSDHSLQVIDEFGGRVTVATEARRGSSAARNKGIAVASHDLLAFTDADCVARPNWLSEFIKHWRDQPGVILMGGPILARQPTTRVARFAEELFDQEAAIEKYTPPSIITANVLATRKDLQTVGLFNEDYLRSQDVELSFRAYYDHDARFKYCRSAVVEHFNVRTLRGLIHKSWQHGTGGAHLWQDYQQRLGRSAIDRARNTEPYKQLFKELGRQMIPFKRGSVEPEEAAYSLYGAIHEAVRQLAFAYTTWRYEAHND